MDVDTHKTSDNSSHSDTDSADVTEEDIILNTTTDDDDGDVCRNYSQLVGNPDVELPMHPADYPIPYCRGVGFTLVPIRIPVHSFECGRCDLSSGSESDNASEHSSERDS